MYANLFAPTLPDWQSFKKLNENRSLTEAELVQKYKKLSLAQDTMIAESFRAINSQNEALINAQGGGGASGGSRNTAQITNVQQFIGGTSNATGFYRYTSGFAAAANVANIIVTYDRDVLVSGGTPAIIPNNNRSGGGSAEIIFSYAGTLNSPTPTLVFEYSQSAVTASSIVVATSQVDVANNSIEFTGGLNNFKRGNRVQYSAEGGTILEGLKDGGVYYVLQGFPSPSAQFALGELQPQADAEEGNPFYQDPSTIPLTNLTGTGNNAQTFKCLTPFIAAGTVGDLNGTFNALSMAASANMNSGSFSGSFSSSLFVSSSNRLYISASGLVIVSGTVNGSRALTALTASMTSTNPVDGDRNKFLTVGDTVDLPNNFFGNQNSGSRITLTSAAFLTGSLEGGGQDTLLFRGNSLWTNDNGGSKYPGVGGTIVDAADRELADVDYDTTVIQIPRERTTLNT